jgi:hypothetical protein
MKALKIEFLSFCLLGEVRLLSIEHLPQRLDGLLL